MPCSFILSLKLRSRRTKRFPNQAWMYHIYSKELVVSLVSTIAPETCYTSRNIISSSTSIPLYANVLHLQRVFHLTILIVFKKVKCCNSTDINDCYPNPCLNEGNCTDKVSSYNCLCVKGFNGTNCEIKKIAVLYITINTFKC